jgi:hypothetical protein
VLVDIRKASEVDSKGSPTMPKGQAAKLVRVEFDTIAGARAARRRCMHAHISRQHGHAQPSHQ